jgi:hypothetical protein
VNIKPNGTAPQWHGIGWYQEYNLNDADCPFKSGSAYQFRALIQTSNCAVRIYAGVWDAEGHWIDIPNWCVRASSADQNTWVESTWLNFTIPANARYFAVGMQVQLQDIGLGLSQATGKADDFEARKVG